ncbi:MAG: hypothetical protein ABR539_14025, partial [Halomonas sp.]
QRQFISQSYDIFSMADWRTMTSFIIGFRRGTAETGQVDKKQPVVLLKHRNQATPYAFDRNQSHESSIAVQCHGQARPRKHLPAVYLTAKLPSALDLANPSTATEHQYLI